MTTEKQINLFELGALVNLRIGFWSARKMISKSDMISLGLDPSVFPKDIANYGRKLLVSKSTIQSFSRIDQKARSALREHSIPFGPANAYFVPAKRLPNLEAGLQQYKQDFFKLVDQFILNFNTSKEKIQEKYPDFYNKCLKAWYPQTPEQLRGKFKFDWFVFKIAGADSLEETTVEDVVASNQIVEERKRLLSNKMKSEVDQFVQDYVSQMRKETIGFCELMEARVKGTTYGDEKEPKQLTARSLSFFKKHIDKFQQMNIFNDDQIQKLLVDFKNNYLDEGVTAKSFENVNLQNSVANALQSIKNAAAMENEQSSQFVDSLKRKIRI